METPFFSYTGLVTESEFVDYYKFALDYEPKTKKVINTQKILISIVFTITFFMLFRFDNYFGFNIFLVLLLLSQIPIIILLKPMMKNSPTNYIKLNRQRKDNSMDVIHVVSFYDNYMVESSELIETKLMYSFFDSLYAGVSGYYLICSANNLLIIVPYRYFSSSYEKESFYNLISIKINQAKNA